MTSSFRQLCADAKLSQDKIAIALPFLINTYGDVKSFLDHIERAPADWYKGEYVSWPEGLDEYDYHKLRLTALRAIRFLTSLPPKRVKEFRKLCVEADIAEKKVDMLAFVLARTYENRDDFFAEVAAGGPTLDEEDVSLTDVHRLRMASLRHMRPPSCSII